MTHKHRFRRLPVVDRTEKLVATIAETDSCRTFDDRFAGGNARGAWRCVSRKGWAPLMATSLAGVIVGALLGEPKAEAGE